MKILVTGGHFSAAYAVIAELKKRGHDVAVVGRKHAMEGDSAESFEYQICKKENIEFFDLKTGRLQRRLTTKTITSLLKVPNGFVQSLKIISKYKPDVVLTFGGYIGLPVSYAAKLKGVPVVLHEQTQRGGVAAKNIARIATKVCLSFESSMQFFDKKKIIVTGNPLRADLFKVEKKINLENKKVIYVTGGSTGSHLINSMIYRIVDMLLDDYVVIHQTGESSYHTDFEDLEKLRSGFSKAKQNKYILRKFIYPDEIGFVFKSADLVLSRSGANTVYEIIALEKTSLLIPLSHGQSNEQLDNAKLVDYLKIGCFLEEKDLTPDVLYQKIVEVLKNEEGYKKNSNTAKSIIIFDAEKRIADVVEEVYKLHGKQSSQAQV
ncbi:MAG TPA: UDP-N-acetylglucosamine--N-acetylmuramyl-(pentapeptide) pyrophosphoryl-undecaprenol N-acetylglucosamine transferase [Patescibacteria group bacterium]|nr:UDP-N-acetylglucosamine--N-acetylmuramyl-(pentapeptide) pyrophosphoryl-undecaprenol N-acetylglucosamine transferase [Patescibacteria group bacterium]